MFGRQPQEGLRLQDRGHPARIARVPLEFHDLVAGHLLVPCEEGVEQLAVDAHETDRGLGGRGELPRLLMAQGVFRERARRDRLCRLTLGDECRRAAQQVEGPGIDVALTKQRRTGRDLLDARLCGQLRKVRQRERIQRDEALEYGVELGGG